MEPSDLVPAGDESRIPSDHTLLRRLRGGCEDAATQLYLRYAQRLLALIRSRASPQVRRRVDYEEVGGAPLLGVDGVGLIAHGRSSARAILNALSGAEAFAAQKLSGELAAAAGRAANLLED